DTYDDYPSDLFEAPSPIVMQGAQALHALGCVDTIAGRECPNALPTHSTEVMQSSAVVDAVSDDSKAECLMDEYHTIDDLYEYRMLDNAIAANAMPESASKSWRHSDGELCFGGGWFVVYMELPSGQVSNHYKAEHWELFKVKALHKAPPYDGHTPAEA